MEERSDTFSGSAQVPSGNPAVADGASYVSYVFLRKTMFKFGEVNTVRLTCRNNVIHARPPRADVVSHRIAAGGHGAADGAVVHGRVGRVAKLGGRRRR